MKQNADVYIINRENVEWLCQNYKFNFDIVVIDELSSFKSHTAKRFKALRKVRPHVKRIIGLTGTPAPNSLMDLWSEINLLDMGQRLGRFITNYRNEYFMPDKRNQEVIFDELKKVKNIHNKKLEALEDLIEAANGKSVLIFYAYKHDKERISERFKVTEILTSADITKWNKGEIPIAIAHPASTGHGLNLQGGGSTVIWFGLTWSLELYQQANARLWRQGQK